jgi:hypothetical protein
MTIRHRRAGLAALCVVAIAVVPGCATEKDARETRAGSTPTALSGPWGQEFAEAVADSKSSYERSVLRDGVVTSKELADAHSRMNRCLADADMKITYYEDGGFELGSRDGGEPPGGFESSNRILEACEAKFDRYVTSLYQQTRRNPEKQDDAKITVACLRKSGLVGADYTPKRWQRDYDAQKFPYDEWSAEAKQCEYDPLGLWRDK